MSKGLSNIIVANLANSRLNDVFGLRAALRNTANDFASRLQAQVAALGGVAYIADPRFVFTDAAGTLPATFGGPVGGLRASVGGAVVATQATAAARPTFARAPAGGVRNRLPQNDVGGAVVGVVGSGGSLPSGWSVLAAGTTIEVVSIASVNGLPAITVTITGTPSANVTFSLSTTTAVIASSGQTWARSVHLQIIGGNLDGFLGINHGVRNYASGVNHSYKGSVITPTAEFTRYSGADAIADADGSGTITSIRQEVTLLRESGAVNLTLVISAPQLEQSSAASAVQVTSANGFDITEAGQRSVYSLVPDGIDDFMSLVTPFEPAGAYTVMAAGLWATGYPAFLPFGSVSGLSHATFGVGVSILADTTSNLISFPSISGWPFLGDGARRVETIRVDSATAGQAFRNGTPYPGSPDVTGNAVPLSGFNTMMRTGGTYSATPVIAAVAIPSAISDAQRLAIQTTLARLSGVTLA